MKGEGEGGQKSQKIDDVFYEWPLVTNVILAAALKANEIAGVVVLCVPHWNYVSLTKRMSKILTDFQIKVKFLIVVD